MLTRIRKSIEEKNEGFTLIELLVVIIIIGILAAIAIPVFLNQRKKGYDAQAKSDLRNLATLEETYLTDNNKYTVTVGTGGITDFHKSPNAATSVVSVRPASTGTDSFCLKSVSDSTLIWYYDSATGGLTTANAACS